MPSVKKPPVFSFRIKKTRTRWVNMNSSPSCTTSSPEGAEDGGFPCGRVCSPGGESRAAGPERREVIKAQHRFGTSCHDEDTGRDNCPGTRELHYLAHLKSPQLQSHQALLFDSVSLRDTSSWYISELSAFIGVILSAELWTCRG